MKKTIHHHSGLIILLTLLCIAVIIPTVYAVSEAARSEAKEQSPLLVRIQKEDCLAISEQGFHSMFARSSALLDRKVDVALSASALETDSLHMVMNGEEAGTPYALNVFLFDRPTETAKLIEKKDTFVLVSEKILEPCDREIAEYMLLLEKLDKHPEYYEYAMKTYLENPEAFYQLNHQASHIVIVCETYKEHGYDSVYDYWFAVDQGVCKNNGDLYLVNLSYPEVARVGDPDRTNLFEAYLTEKATNEAKQ